MTSSTQMPSLRQSPFAPFDAKNVFLQKKHFVAISLMDDARKFSETSLIQRISFPRCGSCCMDQAAASFAVCGGCEVVFYCNEECQRFHWIDSHGKKCLVVKQQPWKTH